MLLVSVLAGVGLAGMLPGLFLVVSSVGLVFPNATALAMADHPDRAGSASALLGLCQYVFGAAAAPLVGMAGTGHGGADGGGDRGLCRRRGGRLPGPRGPPAAGSPVRIRPQVA